MLRTVRTKGSRKPADRHSIMVCDRCEAECPESKRNGRTIREGQDAAYVAAKSTPGWTEVATPSPGRRRRMTWTLELLCPTCTKAVGKSEGGAS